MRAKEFLLEYNRDITIQSLGKAIYDRLLREGPSWWERLGIDEKNFTRPNANTVHNVAYTVLEMLERTDPTQNKQYVQWLARTYTRGGVHLEDVLSQLGPVLSKYYTLVQRRKIPVPYNDINRFKDFHDFSQLVDQYEDPAAMVQNVSKGQAVQVYDDRDLRIIVPKDQEAACYYGQGTKWCTAATQGAHNYFSTYNKKGPLYIIIPKKPAYTGEKYQWQFETKQFMNEKDINSRIIDLVTRYPQLRNVFAEQAKKFNIKALLVDTTEYMELIKGFDKEMNRRVVNFVKTDSSGIANKIVKNLWEEQGDLLDGMVDPQELYDDIVQSFERYGQDLVNRIMDVVGDDVELYKDVDRFYDLITEQVRDWSEENDFYAMVLEAFEDLDEHDGMMQAAFTIVGSIESWLGGEFNRIAKELL